MSPAALVLLLALGAGAAGDAEAERAAVRERLAAQKATLSLIEGRRVTVLEALELLEALARGSARRVAVLEDQLRVHRRRAAAAGREAAATRALLEERVARLSPRLRARYRLLRHRPLEALLTAQDLSQAVWRTRALEATLQGDLVLLSEVRAAQGLREAAREELARVAGALQEHVALLREQAALAQAQRLALVDVVSSLASEASHGRRVVRELEVADAELTRLVEELEAALPASGFGALRGRLPFPAQGVVEVPYGKVVNPRFNTVTVQKGLDIRAPAGAPVRAVADGRAAWVGWLRGYGNLVILDHGDGYHSLVAHLADLAVAQGAAVTAGQVLGQVGDTGSLKGAYLYFEIRKRGQALDPGPWLAASPGR